MPKKVVYSMSIKDKKGAVEFSLTTILVIIIGIIVLSLAINWVRTTFGQAAELTQRGLENAETVFGEVALSNKISAPATIRLDRNDAKKFRVLVKNVDDVIGTFKMNNILLGATESCLAPVTTTTGDVVIEAGGTAEFGAGIISACGASKDNILKIIISKKTAGGTYDEYASEAIAVEVR